MNKSPYDYYYGNEANQYTFYRLPKALFTNDRYKKLSDGAKILYGLMLDRMSLSIKNNWTDDQDRVYIIFTLEDVQEYMNCKHDKGIKMLSELDTSKGVGLIERVKQGQGKPSIIYVRKFFDTDPSEPTESQTSEMSKSRLRNNRTQDFGYSEPNNTYINNTEPNETQSINQNNTPIGGIDRMDGKEAYRDIVKENIEYESLCTDYDSERMTEILEIILETVCTSRKTIRIGSEDFTASVVKSQFLKINRCHVEYVFGCIDKNTTKIRNIKSYLLTALYNAPLTMNHYYTVEVNHDLYGDST